MLPYSNPTPHFPTSHFLHPHLYVSLISRFVCRYAGRAKGRRGARGDAQEDEPVVNELVNLHRLNELWHIAGALNTQDIKKLVHNSPHILLTNLPHRVQNEILQLIKRIHALDIA
ncbi:hypothetical protein PIB30_079576 [Stylosanthes scabra]|uniref:Uncharacterized protein n=1 Tax=Stylosanthes scabra TaxID=79078 RepID=A0ABU6ZPV4_9FABA|nr:hypothetical protein [Stylosanthes scabra]